MKYEIRRYYSTFFTYEVEAASEEEAYNKTKEIEINVTELQNNLKDWKEADEVIPMTSQTTW